MKRTKREGKVSSDERITEVSAVKHVVVRGEEYEEEQEEENKKGEEGF